MIPCPKCGTFAETLPASYSLTGYRCPACGAEGILPAVSLRSSPAKPPTRRPRPVQYKLPGIEPGRPTSRVKIKEEVVHRQVMGALCAAGYIVLQTTVRYKWQHCPFCHRKHRTEGGYGATPGVPDLLVSHPDWPKLGVSVWVGIEVKGTETRLSDEQKELAARNHIIICRDAQTALETVRAIDALLRAMPRPVPALA